MDYKPNRPGRSATPQPTAPNPEPSPPTATGPRLPTGKARSSQNALKHGMLSRRLVITAGPLAEDPAEYDDLVAECREMYQPHGPREDALVLRIAACTWRLARVHRFEAGAADRQAALPQESTEELAECEENIALAELGVQNRQNILQQLRGEPDFDLDTACDNPLLNSAFFQLAFECHCPLNLGIPLVEAHRKLIAALRKAGLTDDRIRQQLFKTQVHAIERSERELARYQTERSHIEAHAQRSDENDYFALPDAQDLNRLIRYETMIQCDLNRTLNRLERLQRERINPAKEYEPAVDPKVEAAPQ